MDSYPEIPGAPDAPLTVRDWFAGRALNGILSSQNATTGVIPLEEADRAAEASYEFADAMMRARKA